jgi:hypothetical protein
VFPNMASGYRAEIEQMQQEVLDYLTRHASETVPSLNTGLGPRARSERATAYR